MSTQEAAESLALLFLGGNVSEKEYYGENDPDWLLFLKDFKSAKSYSDFIKRFIGFCEEKNFKPDNLVNAAVAFFDHLRETKKPDGTRHYAPSNYRPWFSILKVFFEHTGRGNLEVLSPIIETLIGRWESGHQTKKASTFSKDELLKFMLEAPNDEKFLLKKAYLVVAKAFAARGIEAVDVECCDIQHVQTTDGEDMYYISYERSKQRGLTRDSDKNALITGRIEVDCLKMYLSTFESGMRDAAEGRLWRKLTANKEGKLLATKQKVGKNTIANYGKDIARYLQLPEPEKYTGHFIRRTVTTLAAESGLTVQQIKCLTGHKSDAVVQGYIDNSNAMKVTGSRSIELEPAKRQRIDPPAATDTVTFTKVNDKPTGNSYNITINLEGGTMHGPLSLFSSNTH